MAITAVVGGKGLPPYDLGVYGLGGWNGHNRRSWRQRVAALLAYASFPRSGVGRQTVWEPQAPAWVCGLGFRRPHAQAGASKPLG